MLQRTAENVASSLFAVTLQCAKCHDHKYDAISQLDYYRFQAAFAPIFNVRNWQVSVSRTRSDVSDRQKQMIDQGNAEIDAESKKLSGRRDAVRSAHRNRLFEQQLAKLSEDKRAAIRTALKTAKERRNAGQKALVKEFGSQLTISEEQLTAALNDAERKELSDISVTLARLRAQRRSYDPIALATETAVAATTHVLRRGNWMRPGLEVEAELFDLFAETSDPLRLAADSPAGLSGRRLALACAVTDSNSLTGQHVARVFVNRVWQQLFGRGIVETSDNFGVSGSRPSHPELLDWLTHRFIQGGWEIKPLIRMLVTSST